MFPGGMSRFISLITPEIPLGKPISFLSKFAYELQGDWPSKIYGQDLRKNLKFLPVFISHLIQNILRNTFDHRASIRETFP